MTIEEQGRIDRLEAALARMANLTNSFIADASEANNTLTAGVAALNRTADVLAHAIQDHEAILHALQHTVQVHSAEIGQLKEMITRFDEWLRGQGPSNGRERGKGNG